MTCSLGGCCGRPTILAEGLCSPVQLAVDAYNVYWTSLYVGTVMSLA